MEVLTLRDPTRVAGRYEDIGAFPQIPVWTPAYRPLRPDMATGLQEQEQRLQEYNFTSEHHQGRKHTNVDALSRRPCLEECSHCRKVEQRAGGC
jgi:hypothetical protein